MVVGHIGLLNNYDQPYSVDLENPQLLIQRLIEQYGVRNSEIKKQDCSLVSIESKVSGEKKLSEENKNIIILRAHGGSPEEVKKYLDNIVSELNDNHYQLYMKVVSAQSGYYQYLINELSNLDEELVNNHVYFQSDSNRSSKRNWERDRIIYQRLEVKQKKTAIDLINSGLFTSPTRILQEPTLPTKPITNKWRLLILIISSGLLVGILSAILLEYQCKANNIIANGDSNVDLQE